MSKLLDICKPFVKWPGGKSEEVPIIHNYLPEQINNYIEPFLGGGACFFSLNPNQYGHAYVNDLSQELIQMYQFIRDQDEHYFQCLNDIWNFWSFSGAFFQTHEESLINLYIRYKENELDKEAVKDEVNHLIDRDIDAIYLHLPDCLNISSQQLILELKKSIQSKINNIKRKEEKTGELPLSDYSANLESGVRAGVYTYYRYLYNHPTLYSNSQHLQTALFFYLREFCYSSMFRYNSKGEFNVPYGGLSYNSKSFITKINYLQSETLLGRLSKALFYSEDFEVFLRRIPMEANDFIFLDPPYDGGFSTYAKNTFEQEDQRRLANYLINDCPAHFMLIIKNTDFIASLYENKENIQVEGFDKDYKVSFMDRNNKKVEHLLIKNY